MRAVAGLTLLFLCRAACGQLPSLKDLYEHQVWFRLREAVLAAQDPPLFYRAAIAVAFHQDDAAEKMLQDVIRSMPGSWEATEAESLYDGFQIRSGRQSKQSVANPKPCRIHCKLKRGCLYIPVTINGRKVEYLLDTGAGTSVVSESEAKRLGLTLEKIDSHAFDGATGRQIPVRYRGIARLFAVGNWAIRNTVFLVFPDDTFFFKGLPPRESGIIGLPAIQALETVRWDGEGNFDIGFRSSPADAGPPNLAFESDRVVVEVGFQGNRLTFGLDTGAENSGLYVGFRNRFADLVKASGRKDRVSGGGASGTIDYDAIILPDVKLLAGGLETLLQPAEITLKEDLGSGHYGNFGLDLLNQARVVTIDFRTMRLTLDGRRPDAELQTLFQTNRWYELREALGALPGSPFYRGAVACAFHEAATCEQSLHAAIRRTPDSDQAYSARGLLTYHYSRTGRPRQALQQLREMHKQRPDAADVNDSAGCFAALAHSPNQSVARRVPSTLVLRGKGMVVPVSINGRNVEYQLDFSSALSAITESEAKRLGLALRTTGNCSDAKSVAVAGRLTIGSTELRHVGFFVYPDDEPRFTGLPDGRQGRLGLPVILALGGIRWREGQLDIGTHSGPTGVPNLRLDGYTLLAQAGIGSGTAELSIGMADTTKFFSKFVKDFPALAKLPLSLRLGGLDIILNRLVITDEDSPYQGTLGLDLLRQAGSVTFDFNSMTVKLSK
jgi:predicted aspartyl protease